MASARAHRLSCSFDESDGNGFARPSSGSRDCSTSKPRMRMAPASEDIIMATARRLLTIACQRGAQDLIAYLLPTAAGTTSLNGSKPAECLEQPAISFRQCPCSPPNSSEISGGDEYADQQQQPAITAPGSAGLTLLHHAVRSGSALACKALLDGSKQLGITWQVRTEPLGFPVNFSIVS